MGDRVDEILEGYIRELEDLIIKGICSREEINRIVNMRRDFEYKINSNKPFKEDFLKYAEYELNLVELIKLRKKKEDMKYETVFEQKIHPRLMNLFFRATRRFPKDIKLWYQMIDFCMKQGDKTTIVNSISNAIKQHPNKSKFWILACQYEFKHNVNIYTAREIIQRGIKYNPKNRKLWIEYFKLELIYMTKMHNSIENTSGDKKDRESLFKLDTIDLPDEEKEEEEDSKTDFKKFLETPYLKGEVLNAIYNLAVEEIPDNLNFKKQFLDICSRSLKLTSNTQKLILDDLLEKFEDKAKVWDMVSRGKWDSLCYEKDIKEGAWTEKFFSILGNYVKGIKKFLEENNTKQSQKLSLYLLSFSKFVLEKFSVVSVLSNTQSIVEKTIKQTKEQLLALEKKNIFTKRLYLELVEFLLNTGNDTEGLKISANSVKSFPDEPSIVVSHANVLIKSLSVSLSSAKSDLSDKNPLVAQLNGLFQNGLTNKNLSSTFDFCSLYIDFLLLSHYDEKDLAKNFLSLLYRINKSDSPKLQIKCFQVATILFAQNVVDYMVEEMIKNRFLSLEFCFLCIDYESQKQDSDLERIRRLYESFVPLHGNSSTKLWLHYAKFELRHNNSKFANIYWRAKKMLEDPTIFIEECDTLKNTIY